MASDKVQYVVALIAEFAEHYGMTTAQAAKYLSQYKALELYDRQYGYLHTQSFASNVRDLSAAARAARRVGHCRLLWQRPYAEGARRVGQHRHGVALPRHHVRHHARSDAARPRERLLVLDDTAC